MKHLFFLIRFSILLCFLFAMTSKLSYAQRYLVLDKYKPKRIYLEVGDRIEFKLQNDRQKYQDQIIGMQDSVVFLANLGKVELHEFDRFYFPRGWVQWYSNSATLVGGGFMLAAAVHPLFDRPFYIQRESFQIGLFFLSSVVLVYPLRYRKFKVNDKARIRVLDISFNKEKPTEEDNNPLPKRNR
ncbi:MAG: hypothetical protein JJT94_02765 [Bernardetiaceae bacterium]|nr:hypothetical protein [Bernardetiaceae bacterium]